MADLKVKWGEENNTALQREDAAQGGSNFNY